MVLFEHLHDRSGFSTRIDLFNTWQCVLWLLTDLVQANDLGFAPRRSRRILEVFFGQRNVCRIRVFVIAYSSSADANAVVAVDAFFEFDEHQEWAGVCGDVLPPSLALAAQFFHKITLFAQSIERDIHCVVSTLGVVVLHRVHHTFRPGLLECFAHGRNSVHVGHRNQQCFEYVADGTMSGRRYGRSE